MEVCLKRLIILLLPVLFLSILGCSGEFDKKFYYSPEKPKVGEVITVRYIPTNTELVNAKQLEMLVYQFSDEETKASEVIMSNKGRVRIGKFVPDTTTLLIMIQFQSGEAIDNNDRKGYPIMFYGSDGQYIAGGHGSLASVINNFGYPMDLERDIQLAIKTLKQEFALYPDQQGKYQDLYWNLLMRVDKKKGRDTVIAQLDSIASKANLTLEEKKLLADWYSKLDFDEKAERYKKQIRKAESKGHLVQSERFYEFYNTADIGIKLKLFKQFQKDFPDNERLSYMTSKMLEAYLNTKQYDNAQQFLDKVALSPTLYDYNKLAWSLAENEINLETAFEITQKVIKMARSDLDAPISEKPSHLTEKQWRGDQNYTLGNVLDTNGFVLYKMNRIPDSVPFFEKAVKLTNRKENDINERYARALLDVQQYDKAFQFLESLLKEGKSSQTVRDLFKRAYIAVNGSEAGLDSILDTFQDNELNMLRTELTKKMLDKQAPDFTLTNLDGKSVSLSDFRGKTIIIDFWATWCGPCRRSFPAMQKAVDKFKSDENVKFLFINTWEREKNVNKKVSDFIAKNNYNLYVLLDLQNSAVLDYKVEGIPTKFVIDKNGKIRFKSIGFEGDDEKLMQELSMMIEIIQ